MFHYHSAICHNISSKNVRILLFCSYCSFLFFINSSMWEFKQTSVAVVTNVTPTPTDNWCFDRARLLETSGHKSHHFMQQYFVYSTWYYFYRYSILWSRAPRARCQRLKCQCTPLRAREQINRCRFDKTHSSPSNVIGYYIKWYDEIIVDHVTH